MQNQPSNVSAIESAYTELLGCLQKSNSFQEKYRKKPIDRNLYPYEILKYGSVVNGLSSTTSDIDVTFIINDYRIEHRNILDNVKDVLTKHGNGRYVFK